MSRVKKLLALTTMSALLMGTLAGCGGTGDGQQADNQPAAEDKYVVAIVQHIDHPSLNEIRESIIGEFEDQGFGDQIEVVYKNANGDASVLTSIMQDLVSDEVDMIVPIATNTAQTAMATTSDIPIVFSAVSNPVEAGLVTAFDQTTGNITGVSNAIAIEDIFVLAQELSPEAKTFGFIYNSSEINSETGIKRAKAYCDANGLQYKEATVTGTADVQQAASSLVGDVDAFFTPNDNTVAAAMATYLQVANDAELPIYVGADSMVKDGGLATVGINYTTLGKQTAQMVIRIYQGAAIADTPVEQINSYAEMINRKTAEELGLTISEEMLERFTVIE